MNKLLEADEIDPKAFLNRYPLLGIEQAFVAKGWAVRGENDYGKLNVDGDVRWIVTVYEHAGSIHASFYGEKLMDSESRHWEDFSIDGDIVLQPNETADDFVCNIEDFLCDKTGPIFDPEQAAYDAHFYYDDEDR